MKAKRNTFHFMTLLTIIPRINFSLTSKNPIFALFLATFAQNWPDDSFPKNSVFLNFYPLWTSNFVQNIKKIQWADIDQYTKS